MDIREIIRRYRAGQTIRSIASTMEYDRKTVRKYINQLRAKGMLNSEAMVEYNELARMPGDNVAQPCHAGRNFQRSGFGLSSNEVGILFKTHIVAVEFMLPEWGKPFLFSISSR